MRREGDGVECDKFCTDVDKSYGRCLVYLEKWIKPMKEFDCFKWMALVEIPIWGDVEKCLLYLVDKGVEINDTKCFDQLINLKGFVEINKDDETFQDLLIHQKWTKYFTQSKSIDCHSELLKIAQFFFAIQSHNANVERVFSLMQSQWTKERNRLSVQTMKGIIMVQYNYKDFLCTDFYSYLRENQKVLAAIRSSEKYTWAQKEKNTNSEENENN